MGGLRRVSCLLFFFLAGACGRHEPALAATDGVLQLELGGGRHASLRATLTDAGIVVGAPVPLGDAGTGSPSANEVESSPVLPDVEPAITQETPPPAPPEPVSEDLVVTLAPNQTITFLAKKYLGNGNRFREILQANGWNEESVKGLKPGQVVRIPGAGRTSQRR
jgi:nucleoid-associated protein YgaU